MRIPLMGLVALISCLEARVENIAPRSHTNQPRVMDVSHSGTPSLRQTREFSP